MLGDASCKLALQLLGYVWPAYKTYKAVHLPATRSNDALLRRWCQYWALMAVFTAVQPLADTFCFWVPLYYEAKLAAAVYLWANDLAGAQHVWARWFQPAVSQYEPVVDRRLAESKAVAKDWLHSNAMRLLALAQARALAWLASVQQQAAAAAGRPAAAHAHADGGAAEHGEEDEEPAPLGGRETRARRRAAAAAPAKRASGRGEAAGGSGKAAGGGEVPGEELQARRSSFSLATFFSARSGDLQAEDMAAGLKSLKAYPLSAGGSPELQDHDD